MDEEEAGGRITGFLSPGVSLGPLSTNIQNRINKIITVKQ